MDGRTGRPEGSHFVGGVDAGLGPSKLQGTKGGQ